MTNDQKEAIQSLIDKTMKELKEAGKPVIQSRSWKTSQGYKFLIQWSNLVLLRIMVRKITGILPKCEYRGKAQVDDAARSAVANLEEGWKRSKTKEYIDFIGYSQGSLEEVKGDVERWLQDGFITSKKGSLIKDLGIDLKVWNEYCRVPLNSSKILYFPLIKGDYRNLKEVKGKDLTYEMFIELINKTDYLLRTLVVSLEDKLRRDKVKQYGY